MAKVTAQQIRNTLARAGHKGFKTALRNTVAHGGYKVAGDWVTYRLGDSENQGRADEIKRSVCLRYEETLTAAGYRVANNGTSLSVSR